MNEKAGYVETMRTREAILAARESLRPFLEKARAKAAARKSKQSRWVARSKAGLVGKPAPGIPDSEVEKMLLRIR